MASNILRRSLTTAASAKTLKIGLLPADGIGREGETACFLVLLWQFKVINAQFLFITDL